MSATDGPVSDLDVNAGCTHKRVTHVHGSRTCYVVDRCRCALCTAAATAYAAVQNRRKAYELANPGVDKYAAYVPADTALAHLNDLLAAGLGFKTIARRAGVAASSIGAILWPTPSRGRDRRTKIRVATRDRILAVPIPDTSALAFGRQTSPVPTSNRIRALHHLGYGMEEISRRAHLDPQRVRRAANHPEGLTVVSTHNAIAALFADRWSTPNEPNEWRAKIAAARARNRAKSEGWPAPIELDEDGFVEALDAPSSDDKWVAA